MKRHRAEHGFTLMELVVVIVIVAILAAVAVPLYINYVKDAQRAEAKGAIGAIISAQQVHYERTAGLGTATFADLVALKSANEVDLTEAETGWSFMIDQVTATTYHVTASRKVVAPATPDPTLTVTYTYHRATGGVFTP